MAGLKFDRKTILVGVILIFIILGVSYYNSRSALAIKEGFANTVISGFGGFAHGMYYNKNTKLLYIADFSNSRVFIYNPSNNSFMNTFSVGPNPIAITSDSKGNIYLGYWPGSSAARYSSTGQLLQNFNLAGSSYNWSFAIDESDNIYYTNSSGNIYRIPVGSTTSQMLISGGPTYPYSSLVYDSISKSLILTTSNGTHQIPLLSPSFNLKISSGTYSYGSFIDGARNLYVCYGGSNINIYNINTWQFVRTIIETGTVVYSIAIDDAGIVYGASSQLYRLTNIGAVGANADCELDPNNPYILGTCTGTCGTGTQTKTPNVKTQPAGTGKACPTATTQSCTLQPCPVNCAVSEWSAWGACSATCGSGTQTRTRTVITQAAYGGTACPALTETQACPGLQPCPVNCVVNSSNPQTLGPCQGPPDCEANPTTISGTQTVTPNITTPAAFGGTACPAPSTQKCKLSKICEIVPSNDLSPVQGSPFSCSNTYTLKMYKTEISASNEVSFSALLIPKNGSSTGIPTTTVWSVTNQPNFQKYTHNFTPNIYTFEEKVTYKFELIGTYNINYSVSAGGDTCSFDFSVNVVKNLVANCNPTTQSVDPKTNTCLDIVAPKRPAGTAGTPTAKDVKCPPGQFTDCPIVYLNAETGQYQATNPCGEGTAYDFDTQKCRRKNDYCCKYPSAKAAFQDTDCKPLLKEARNLVAAKTATCTTNKSDICCDVKNATNFKCKSYWGDLSYTWSPAPKCDGVDAFMNYSSDVRGRVPNVKNGWMSPLDN